MRDRRLNMTGTALGNVSRCYSTSPFDFACSPPPLFTLDYSTPLDISQLLLQKWGPINVSEMEKISCFLPYTQNSE